MTKTKPISVLVSFIYKGKTYSGVTSSISSGKWERGACYTYSMVVDFKNLTPDSDTKSSFSDLGGLTLELVSETAL
ncbi:MAG: hypothetical protein MJY62_05435, partial [Bacteroidales bacterium]|nr:hypothetical protein [Bacteroidales bacterium]